MAFSSFFLYWQDFCYAFSVFLLSLGVAHTNNTASQGVIFEEKAVPTLLELLRNHVSLQVKVII